VESKKGDALKDELKSYLIEQLKRVNSGLNTLLNENIVQPMTESIGKISTIEKEIDELKKSVTGLENRSDKMERTAARKGSEPPGPAVLQVPSDQPGLASVDESVAMIATHVEETMNFVLLINSMIDGKRKYTPIEMAERVVNDYGSIMGKRLVEALSRVLKDSRKQNLKAACDDILTKLEDGKR